MSTERTPEHDPIPVTDDAGSKPLTTPTYQFIIALAAVLVVLAGLVAVIALYAPDEPSHANPDRMESSQAEETGVVPRHTDDGSAYGDGSAVTPQEEPSSTPDEGDVVEEAPEASPGIEEENADPSPDPDRAAPSPAGGGENAGEDTRGSEVNPSTDPESTSPENAEDIAPTEPPVAGAAPEPASAAMAEPAAAPVPAAPAPAPKPEPKPAAPSTISVMVRVDASAAGSGTLASGNVNVKPGASVLDALRASGVSTNVQNTALGSYVAAIGGIAEKDHGARSGWVYTVDGASASTSAANYKLKGGESVVWKYVTG